MTVKFKNMIKFGENTAADYTVKCSNLHSLIYFQPPELHVRRTHFYATHTSTEIVGGRGGRTLLVDAIIADPTLNTRANFDAYMEEVDELGGARFQLEVAQPATGDIQTVNACYLVGMQRKNKQELGMVPLPNFVPTPVGPPGNYWLEVVLEIRQPNMKDIILIS